MIRKRRLNARALPTNTAEGGAAASRCASSTPFSVSRAQLWFSAVIAANSTATHISPPLICRAMVGYAVGSNAIANTTTTSSEKNSIPLIESFDRHSSRRSLRRCIHTCPA